MYIYKINKTCRPLDIDFYGTGWQEAEEAELSFFRPESSDHHPLTRAKLLYDISGINGIFLVRDNYITATHNDFQDAVCKDSCVEFFVSPGNSDGYFNFEFNCLGNIHASFSIPPEKSSSGKKETTRLLEEDIASILVFHSIKDLPHKEIEIPTDWTLRFFIPFALIEKYAGMQELKGWTANFYKCADSSSHPHWASWRKLKELRFHDMESFGKLEFM